MDIRAIRRDDFDALVAFAHQMHQESPVYRAMGMDDEKLRQLGERIVAEPERFCGLVALRWGRLAGLLIGFLSETYFGPGKLASDLAVFVPPNVRGSMVATALIRRFEAWARDRGASSVQLGITTGVAPERTGALYQRLGFEPVGLIYRKPTGGR